MPSLTEEEADRIADALGDLAVAVAAAGAYLADTGTPVDAYLEQIERHGSMALPVEATWDLSLARLRTQFPSAFRLLQLCSVLAPEIDLKLLYSNDMVQAMASFDPAVSDHLVMGQLVQQITRSALLTLNKSEERVLVHRLLQAVVRESMTPDEVANTRHEVHLVLAGARPQGDADDPQTWDKFRMLWPHIEPSGVVGSRDKSTRDLIIDRVRYLWRRGELDQANTFAAEADGVWSARLNHLQGNDEVATLHQQLLHLRFNRANVLRALARYDKAHDLDEQVLEEQRELLGDRHPHTLMTASSLGADLRALGRYTEAIERDGKTYKAWREEVGDRHHKTLIAGNNLAHSYRLVGDFRSARTWDEDVLQLRRQVYGQEHPYTLHSAAQLARDLREAGEYVESATTLRPVHEQLASLKEMGSEAGDTLNAQVSLAVSLRCAGQEEEAAELLDAAYPVLEAKFGAGQPRDPDLPGGSGRQSAGTRQDRARRGRGGAGGDDLWAVAGCPPPAHPGCAQQLCRGAASRGPGGSGPRHGRTGRHRAARGARAGPPAHPRGGGEPRRLSCRGGRPGRRDRAPPRDRGPLGGHVRSEPSGHPALSGEPGSRAAGDRRRPGSYDHRRGRLVGRGGRGRPPGRAGAAGRTPGRPDHRPSPVLARTTPVPGREVMRGERDVVIDPSYLTGSEASESMDELRGQCAEEPA